MKIKKRILSFALAGTMTLGLLPAFSSPALAADGDTSYTLTIPSTLTVADKGWNATDGISATGTLASGKKLTVTASSDGEFALVSGTNRVNYKLAASGDTTTTYANATEKTSWEFKTLSETAAHQTMGIIVEDYSTKPAGTYQDTVTFTAKVEDAAPATITVTWNNDDITGEYGNSFTKDGVTITAGNIDFRDKNFMMDGTFTTTLGNFTKIEVTTGICDASGTGWSGSDQSATWTGTPASNVSFSGSIMGMGAGNTKFVFTIEPTN